jgi:hypothetical protein
MTKQFDEALETLKGDCYSFQMNGHPESGKRVAAAEAALRAIHEQDLALLKEMATDAQEMIRRWQWQLNPGSCHEELCPWQNGNGQEGMKSCVECAESAIAKMKVTLAHYREVK